MPDKYTTEFLGSGDGTDPAHDNLENEMKASLAMVESKGRKALIVGILMDGNEGALTRAVSTGITRAQGHGVVAALRLEADRIEGLLKKGK